MAVAHKEIEPKNETAKSDTKSRADVADKAGAKPKIDTKPTIDGNIDALDRQRLFGWVWCPQKPEARIEVLVRINGHKLLAMNAEKERVDLRRNGIGDGRHAFEIELPEAALADPAVLTVWAITPDTSEEVELHIPSQSEQHAKSAMTAPLSRILDRLDRLLAAQHILQNSQKEAAKRLTDASKSMDQLASADDGIEAGVRLVRSSQEDLTKRVEELEVFLVRFDKSLGGFDERLSVLTERHRNDLKAPLLLLSCLIGVAVGLGVGAMAW